MSKIVNDLIEGKLFELMENSSFQNLSPDEKELVENYFSEAEYTAQREMMKELEAFESEAYSEKEISKPITEPETNSESKIKQLFNFKVPGYAVAVMLVIAFGVPQMFKSKSTVEPDNLVKTTIQDSISNQAEERLVRIHPKDSIIIEPEDKMIKQEKSPVLIARDSIETEKLKQ